MKTYLNISVLIAIAYFFVVLPAQSKAIAATLSESPQNWKEKEYSFLEEDSFSKFEVRFKGEISVSDNDKDITTITDGGFLEISKSSFGNKRTLRIEAGENGSLSKKYFEGKNELDFAATGQEWLEELMPVLIRKIGIGTAQRAIRIYSKQGLDALMEEIKKMEDMERFSGTQFYVFYYQKAELQGNNIKNEYIKIILDQITLPENELVKFLEAVSSVRSNSTKGSALRLIIDRYKLNTTLCKLVLNATETLDFNNEKGNVLRKFQSKYPVDKSNYLDYFRVIRSIEINSEKGNVLKPLLLSQKLDDDIMNELLMAVKEFTNPSEAASVLRFAIPAMSDNALVALTLTNTINSLDESYRYLKDELSQMYNSEAKKPEEKINNAGLIELLNIAFSHSANTPKTVALRKLHGSLTSDATLIQKYFEVVKSIDNSMEQYCLLLDLVYSKSFQKEMLPEIYPIVEKLASKDYGHGASAILRATIPYVIEDNALAEKFFAVLSRIKQNSATEEIIRLFCESGKKLNPGLSTYLLKAASEIEVDIEKVNSLLMIKKHMPDDKNLNVVYETVVAGIETRYEYNRAIAKAK